MWAKDYSELTDKLPAELEHFPPIDTAAVTEYANRLFKPYLFTRHDAKRRATARIRAAFSARRQNMQRCKISVFPML